MTKKQLGIFVQVFGLIIWIVLPKELGAWKAIIGITIIFVGGFIYRSAKKEEKK